MHGQHLVRTRPTAVCVQYGQRVHRARVPRLRGARVQVECLSAKLDEPVIMHIIRVKHTIRRLFAHVNLEESTMT